MTLERDSVETHTGKLLKGKIEIALDRTLWLHFKATSAVDAAANDEILARMGKASKIGLWFFHEEITKILAPLYLVVSQMDEKELEIFVYLAVPQIKDRVLRDVQKTS